MIHPRRQIGRFSFPNRENDYTKTGILEFWCGRSEIPNREIYNINSKFWIFSSGDFLKKKKGIGRYRVYAQSSTNYPSGVNSKILSGVNINVLRPYQLSLVMKKTRLFTNAKTKLQIRCAVTALLISAFVFATHIVQSLFFLNPKFQASSYLLWLHSLVCVGPGRKPRRPVFS